MGMIQQTESSPFSLCTAERMSLAHTQNCNHKFQANEIQQRRYLRTLPEMWNWCVTGFLNLDWSVLIDS